MYTQRYLRRFFKLGDVTGRAGLVLVAGCAAVLATALSARSAETVPAPAPTERVDFGP